MDLHYRIYGHQGEPVVLLHGLFGSLDNWNTVSKRLSVEFRVFAVDLRNHGRSPHSPEMTLELMAGDLLEFISRHGLENAHLLGHSLGGKVAMELALGAPDTVRKLVVVDIAPRAYPPHHRYILDALLDVQLARYRTRQEVENALAARIPDLALRRFLIKGIAHESGRPMEWRMDLEAITHNYERLVGELLPGRQFKGPTLFVKGAISGYLRLEDENEIRALFPAAAVKTISGAGHWVHAEAAEEFCREVLAFLH
jgi:pimeloyl-ACP methyl ester carboxylesterase